MKCPDCGLFNPPEALRCDCGYDFTTRQSKKLPLLQRLLAAEPTTASLAHAARLLDLILTVAALGVLVTTFGENGLHQATRVSLLIIGLYFIVTRAWPRTGIGWQAAKLVAHLDKRIKVALAARIQRKGSTTNHQSTGV
jgi:hypothetical protein